MAAEVLERRVAADELVREDAEGPVVDLLRVFSVLHHFWWKIVQSTTKGCPPVTGCVYTPAEVTNLEFTINAKQEILGLNIAVYDVFRMEIDQGIGHLIDVA